MYCILERSTGMPEGPREFGINVDIAFSLITVTEAAVASWLVAEYEDDNLLVATTFPNGWGRQVRFIPQCQLDITTLAWMAIFIANWQMVRVPDDHRDIPTHQSEFSAEVAQCATAILGMPPWEWVKPEIPAEIPARETGAFAMAITFGVDVSVAAEQGYLLALALVASGFETN